ncbi:RusA family crossover junction endodeoxyribonuclease [Burkholderia pseudomallei]|uniref:RusA family crossover junction endodeoxyribonuclease n=1 Tax=Burkholderia pseudomallei TaxID=28450 RepID=UPI000A1CC41B|nr:RusA family crossover junction endodeoxyribonuclease [Burkholderia pseudomallei]
MPATFGTCRARCTSRPRARNCIATCTINPRPSNAMSLETIVSFVVPGIPVGKGRHRSRIAHDDLAREYVQTYPDRKTVKYEKSVAIEAKIAMRGRPPVDGAVCLVVRAFYPIPSSWPQWRKREARIGLLAPRVKPDWDNIGKACSDAMNGVVYRDDVAIVTACVLKRYSLDPRVEIAVYAFEHNPDARAADVDPLGLIEQAERSLAT